MTKSELRAARKAARAAGKPLTADLTLPSDRSPTDSVEFSDSYRGRKALHRWARRYDAFHGAPEGEWDR